MTSDGSSSDGASSVEGGGRRAAGASSLSSPRRSSNASCFFPARAVGWVVESSASEAKGSSSADMLSGGDEWRWTEKRERREGDGRGSSVLPSAADDGRGGASERSHSLLRRAPAERYRAFEHAQATWRTHAVDRSRAAGPGLSVWQAGVGVVRSHKISGLAQGHISFCPSFALSRSAADPRSNPS